MFSADSISIVAHALRRRRSWPLHRRPLSRFVVFCAAFAASAADVQADVFTWDGGGDNNLFETPNNWSTNVAPPSDDPTTDLQFAGSTRLFPNPGRDYQISSLAFNSGAGAFAVGPGGGFRIHGGGITQNSANAQTINVNINRRTAQTWTLASGAGPLTLNGQVSGGHGWIINAAPGTSITFNGEIVSPLGPGEGTTLTGGGTMTLSGGPFPEPGNATTSVSEGMLRLNRAPDFGSGPVALKGSVLIGDNSGAAGSAVVRLLNDRQTSAFETYVSVFTDGLFDMNGFKTPIETLEMTGGTVNVVNQTLALIGDVTVNASSASALIASTDFTNNLLLNSTRRTFFTVANGGATYDLDFQAGITNGDPGLPAANLVKAGPGTMRLAGNVNSYLNVTLNEGTLALASHSALGTTPGKDTFTLAGGTVTADGGDRFFSNAVTMTGSATLGASLDGTPRALTFTGPVTLGASGVTLTVSNNAPTTLSGAVNLGANLLTLAGAGNTTISGPISGTAGLTKTGAGTLTLSGANTSLSGGLTVTGCQQRHDRRRHQRPLRLRRQRRRQLRHRQCLRRRNLRARRQSGCGLSER